MYDVTATSNVIAVKSPGSDILGNISILVHIAARLH